MIQIDTVWYSMIPNPPKVSCVCPRQMAPTCSDTHDFSRSPQKPSHGRINQCTVPSWQVFSKSWYVGDSQISSRSGMSWFPSMMKNVSKAARSPPTFGPSSSDKSNSGLTRDFWILSGSFLDPFWILSDLCAIVLVSDSFPLFSASLQGLAKFLSSQYGAFGRPEWAQNSMEWKPRPCNFL